MDPTRDCFDRPRRSVLVVEDEPTIAEVVAGYLERAGYSTRVAGDGVEALRLAESELPDLAVLDLMLPGIDGLEVMRRLHARGRVHVILLTAKGEPYDRVTGLRRGADDYVVKPFSPAELVARVEAVLRRADDRAEPPERVVCGELEIDPAARRASIGSDEIPLTVLEFDLLHFLARHPGQVFTRDPLMDAVWGSALHRDSSTVTVHVRRLREKIEDDPSRPRRLRTVWGVGYRFQP